MAAAFALEITDLVRQIARWESTETLQTHRRISKRWLRCCDAELMARRIFLVVRVPGIFISRPDEGGGGQYVPLAKHPARPIYRAVRTAGPLDTRRTKRLWIDAPSGTYLETSTDAQGKCGEAYWRENLENKKDDLTWPPADRRTRRDHWLAEASQHRIIRYSANPEELIWNSTVVLNLDALLRHIGHSLTRLVGLTVTRGDPSERTVIDGETLCQLSNLRHLQLTDCDGDYCERDYCCLSNLLSLSLHCADNVKRITECLTGLTGLHFVRYDGNDVVLDLRGLPHLCDLSLGCDSPRTLLHDGVQLTRLCASGMEETDTLLPHTEQIQILELMGCDGLGAALRRTSLRQLDLINMLIPEDIYLPHLEELRLHDCSFIGSWLRYCIKLRRVKVICLLTIELEYLASLMPEELDMDCLTELVGDFRCLSTLTSLRCCTGGIDGSLLPRSLRKLHLGRYGTVDNFAELPDLKELEMQWTDYISYLTQLEILRVPYRTVKEDICRQLRGLTNLRHLSLSATEEVAHSLREMYGELATQGAVAPEVFLQVP